MQMSTLAVIIPAWNAAHDIEACIKAIFQSTRVPNEVILYDDGSDDQTGAIAAGLGVDVIRNNDAPRGPGAGRNICAARTDADILVFVDADVVVEKDAIGSLENEILTSDEIGAAFGSYNDRPSSRRASSLYTNLRHHFVHQQSDENVSHFWSGLGAVRRGLFLSLEGFDTDLFTKPSIEDIELGGRIVNAGYRIKLVKTAQATHLKDWTVKQLWETDIQKRAIPWSKLISSGRLSSGQLNASHIEKVRAVAAHLIWLSALASFTLKLSALYVLFPVVLYGLLNALFFSLLRRKAGMFAGLVGMALHWIYHIYASSILGFFLVKAIILPGREKALPSSVQS